MCYQVKTKPTLTGQAGISQGCDARLGFTTSLLFLGHPDVQADSYYTCPTCSDRKNQRAPLTAAHLWAPYTLKSLPHTSCFQWRLPLSSLILPEGPCSQKSALIRNHREDFWKLYIFVGRLFGFVCVVEFWFWFCLSCVWGLCVPFCN